jgi:NAD(P)H-dependent FMN reductase
MEIETVETSQTIETLPVIETEEELLAMIGEQPKADTKKEEAKPAAKPAAKKVNVIGDNIEDGDLENEDGSGKEGKEDGEEGKDGGKKLSSYPSMIHYLNEVNELGLNLSAEDKFTEDEQAEVVSEMYRRLVDGTNQALREKQQEYKQIEAMLQDEDFRLLVEAKREGKSLKDLYSKFAESPLAVNDDVLAAADFKKRYPKSSNEAVNAMIDSLKKSGQFEPFVQGLREQYQEESKLQTEKEKQLADQTRVQQAAKAQEDLKNYASFLGNLTNVHGVPITNEMKDTIWNISTQADENGQTELDRLLQSDEGTVLASIGVALLKDLITGAGSLTGNRKNNKLMSKLFDSADKLQSSGSGAKTETDDEDYKLLNNF